MTVVDVHVHVYPEAIAERAVQGVGAFYNVEMSGDGSMSALERVFETSPITHAIICSVANKAKQVQSINDFISSAVEQHDNLVGLAAMHQDYEDMEAEIARARSLGLRGFKLHPDSQLVNMDDERFFPLYEICRDEGLPLMIHCGDYRYDFSHPRRLKRLLHLFPGLKVNAAHFGGWMLYDLAVEYLEDEDCFMDVSSAHLYLGDRRVRELVKIYGPERIMFGSDFPMWDPITCFDRFEKVGFTDDELELMCHKNAERFIGAPFN